MDVKTGGLTFQDIVYKQTGNLVLGFITCTDDSSGYNKYYWGQVTRPAQTEQIKSVMETGGKWHGFDENGHVVL